MSEKGCNILALNFSIGSVFGIDKNVWYVGEKFRGIRNIPAGFHIIFYSYADSKGNSTIRRGFFEYFDACRVYPIIWSVENEDIKMDLSSGDIERLENSWDSDKRFTIEYPSDSTHSWHRLTHYVTKAVIDRVGLNRPRIFIGPEFDIVSSTSEKETAAEMNLRKQLNRTEKDLNVSLKFSIIPRACHPQNCTAEEISHHFLDKTYITQNLIDANDLSENFYGSQLLGELQIAFLLFIFGGDLSFKYRSFREY
ncbi:hypothetical protein MXB_5580 [Myxobolus squamalis]|nr:hypothetical protein MXB_5580 [Myxobolus squamalis]